MLDQMSDSSSAGDAGDTPAGSFDVHVEEALASAAQPLLRENSRETAQRVAESHALLAELEEAAIQTVAANQRDSAVELIEELNEEYDWDLIRRCLEGAQGSNELWEVEKWCDSVENDPAAEVASEDEVSRSRESVLAPKTVSISSPDERTQEVLRKARFARGWLERFSRLG